MSPIDAVEAHNLGHFVLGLFFIFIVTSAVLMLTGLFLVRCIDSLFVAQRTAEGAPLRGEVAVREALPAAINFGGCVAPCTSSVPVGNHGDNFPESAA